MSSSFVSFAWRNIWRNKRRTLLTLLAIAFVCAVLIFFISLQMSSYSTAINATTAIFQGHLQIQEEGYNSSPEFHKAFKGSEEILSRIKSVHGVRAASIRATGFSLASTNKRTYGVQVIGVSPGLEPEVSTIPGTIRNGNYLKPQVENQAVVGSLLAKNLRLGIGDEITLLGQGWDGSVAATVLPVVGIFESGATELDRNTVQIPLDYFQELFAMNGRVHSIVIQAHDIDQLEKLKQKLAPLIDSNSELALLDWEELAPGLKQGIELDMASGWLFYFTLVLVVTFTILNTFLMSVLERTREFGMILALGMSPWRIVGMIMLESALLTLLGVCVGLALGALIVLYFGTYGFYIPGTEELMKVWNLPAAIYTKFTVAGMLQGPLGVFVFSMLAALYPALRVTRLEPVEAMRKV